MSQTLQRHDQARDAVAAFLSDTSLDAVEVVLVSSSTALTRFAGSQIIQSTARRQDRAYVRAALGDRTATASTNALHPAALAAALDHAVAAARAAPPDPGFPGLARPDEVGRARPVRRFSDDTEDTSPLRRARAVRALLDAGEGVGAAGYVETGAHAYSVMSSTGMDATDAYTRCAVNCLADAGGSTGWAEAYSHDVDGVDPAATGRRAAERARAGAGAVAASPGTYEVVLEPAAVATLVDYLSYAGFGAKAVIEGESFLAVRRGEIVASPSVSIVDDVHHPASIGLGFDFEGVPRKRVAVIDRGRAMGPVTDRRTAAQLGMDLTGHGSGSTEFGPFAANPVLLPGDRSLDELIGEVESGFLVPRFHYVNILDRPKTLLTGMTRDGVVRIRDGQRAEPVHNFRFTQNVLAALTTVQGVGRDAEVFAPSFGSTVVPALRVASFSFTSTTSH